MVGGTRVCWPQASDRPWSLGGRGTCQVTCLACQLVTGPFLSSGDKQPKKQEKKPATVTSEFVDEALCACEEHLSTLAHMDIDKGLEAPLYLSPEGWSLFLRRYYQVVQ